MSYVCVVIFFFQAEDGIRDWSVTGVQTCALPILVIAGTEDAVLMVESGAKEVSEETMLEAITFGHRECQRLVRAQKELVQRAGKPRWAFDPDAGRDAGLETQVRRLVGEIGRASCRERGGV